MTMMHECAVRWTHLRVWAGLLQVATVDISAVRPVRRATLGGTDEAAEADQQ